MGLAEGPEVVIACQHPPSLVHQVEVELIVDETGMLPHKGVFAGMDIIMIGARLGAESGVHILRHLSHFSHADVRRQQAVEFIGELAAVYCHLGIEVCRHVPGMHAGIGASRPHHLGRLAEQCRQGFLQLRLHGVAIGLHLPSMIRPSVESKEYEIPFCHRAAKVHKKDDMGEYCP